jgi:hypothetical protein
MIVAYKTLAEYIAEGVTFRSFDDSDWSAWAGCESENPMIGESEDGTLTIIVDGNSITVYEYLDDEIFCVLDGSVREY